MQVIMTDWVIPGFGVTQSIEFKNDLVGEAAQNRKSLEANKNE